jgi:hypothetical protein
MAVGLPAKTTYVDGDVFSASDINDTNGTLNLVGQTNNFYAGKNKIINGDFGIWQRGTSFSNPASASFLADRYRFFSGGAGITRTISRETFTAGTAPVAGYEGKFFFRFDQSVAGTGDTFNQMQQKIEDVQTFAGQTATFSFWAKAAATTVLPKVRVSQNFGSGGSADVDVDFATSVSITTGWTRYSYTAAIPSISGKTIGTGSSLVIAIWLPVNATFTFDTWGWQVEAGSTATAFQTATGTIQGELAACQRYYYRATGGQAYSHIGLGYAYSTTASIFEMKLPVTMRTAPSGTLQYGNVALSLTGSGNIAFSTLAYSASEQSPDIVTLNATGSSGLTQYRPYWLLNNNNTAGFVGVSAEL